MPAGGLIVFQSFNMRRLQAAGTARPSFMASLLEEAYGHNGPSAEEVDDIKGAAGVIYGGVSLSSFHSLLRVHLCWSAGTETVRMPIMTSRIVSPIMTCRRR